MVYVTIWFLKYLLCSFPLIFLLKVNRLLEWTRNFIKIFAILFAIVSLYQLSFTWVADGVEGDAVADASEYPAEQQEAREKFYLDSVNLQPVDNILCITNAIGLTKYTYAD